MLPFLAWLLVFYAGWLTVIIAGGYLEAALAHWPMAVAMAAGSYVAGLRAWEPALCQPLIGGEVVFTQKHRATRAQHLTI